jgi:xanthine dehydrogenase YagR molybdenum-binding subunit
MGAQPDGKLDALIHTGTVAMTRHNALPEPFILPARGAYAAKNIKLDVEVAYLDMLGNTFMRAPGESVGTFALESAMDELAEQLGMDPIQLRIRTTSRRRTRYPACPSRRATSSRPIARAPSGSAGRVATPDPARGARATGWSAWAARPRPIPITGCRAARRGSRWRRTAM